MASEWTQTDVASLIEAGELAIGDGYRAKNEELSDRGLPFARVGNINDGFRFDDADRFPEERLAVVGEKVSRAGDVVFTSKGTVGRFAFVKPETESFVYSPQLCYWRSLDPTKIDARFLYYWMSAPEFLNQIGYLKGQTDMADYVSLRDQKRIQITIPDIATQRAITNILASLDDKIELNRRMNATLEQMAQALFKSWFVDFDPVKAKAAGRAPEGMDAETAALFPREFEESELGAIPKGWRSGRLGELCFNYREGVKPGEVEPNTPYIGLEHMPRKSIALGDWGYAAEAESGKSRFCTGDILFGKLRPYFHKVGIAPVGGVCSTDILVIRPNAREFFGITLANLSSVELINYADKLSNGAKMPRTRWDDLAAYQIAIPPMGIAARFSTVVSAAAERIRGNIVESLTLATLRDTLLPKLISGQLRIPDAEKLAEAVL